MRMVFAGLFLAIFLSSCLRDLRPTEFRDPQMYTEARHIKGVEILKKYAEVSGQKKWSYINSYQILMNDNFYGLIGRFAQPFGSKKNQFKLNYYPQENAGTLQFLTGEKIGMIWGYNEGNTYIKEEPSAPTVDIDKKAIKFWLPTYQYFIELPFRISNADIIYHLGEEKYGLEIYDLIFVSWKTPEPQKKLDQYVLWVNQNTGLVDKLNYTIREQGSFLKGTAMIDEHMNYNGIIIPSLFKIYRKEDGTKPIHIMRPYNFVVTDFIIDE